MNELHKFGTALRDCGWSSFRDKDAPRCTFHFSTFKWRIMIMLRCDAKDLWRGNHCSFTQRARRATVTQTNERTYTHWHKKKLTITSMEFASQFILADIYAETEDIYEGITIDQFLCKKSRLTSNHQMRSSTVLRIVLKNKLRFGQLLQRKKVDFRICVMWYFRTLAALSLTAIQQDAKQRSTWTNSLLTNYCKWQKGTSSHSLIATTTTTTTTRTRRFSCWVAVPSFLCA